MINGETMVVLIVAIVMIAGIFKARYRSGEDAGERTARPDPEVQHARDEIRGLKERIAVLERVITDTNTSSTLDREIEKLRDTDR